jgi:cytoskeletal protein RodZ
MNESYFKDFSNRLKDRREDLDITFKKIAEKTNLKKVWIESIESGKFEFAPEVYIKGILRQYAVQIQMDPDEVLKEYGRIREKIDFIAEERYVEVKSFDARSHFSSKEIVDLLIAGKDGSTSEESDKLEAEVRKKLLRERKINLAVMSAGLCLAMLCLFYVFLDSSGRANRLFDGKAEPIAPDAQRLQIKKIRWELSAPILTEQQKLLKEEAGQRISRENADKQNNLKNVSLKKNDTLEPISVQEAARDLEQKISN